jgi:hypothetical protein
MNFNLIESLKQNVESGKHTDQLFEQITELYGDVEKQKLVEAASHLLAGLIHQVKNGDNPNYDDDMWNILAGIMLIGDPETGDAVKDTIAGSKQNPDKFLRTVLHASGKPGTDDSDRANQVLKSITKQINPQAVDRIKHHVKLAFSNEKDRKRVIQYLGKVNFNIMQKATPPKKSADNEEIPPVQQALKLK